MIFGALAHCTRFLVPFGFLRLYALESDPLPCGLLSMRFLLDMFIVYSVIQFFLIIIISPFTGPISIGLFSLMSGFYRISNEFVLNIVLVSMLGSCYIFRIF